MAEEITSATDKVVVSKVSKGIPVDPLVNIKSDEIANSWMMNRYLWYLGNHKAEKYLDLKEDLTIMAKTEFLSKIQHEISKQFPSKCIPVGSSFENSQVGVPNEFDFLFEIEDLEDLTGEMQDVFITPENVMSTKPKEIGMLIPQTYVSIKYENKQENMYNDNSFKQPKRNDIYSLDSRRIQLAFRNRIETALEGLEIESSVRFRGPAVSIMISVPTTYIKSKINSEEGLSKKQRSRKLKILKELGSSIVLKFDMVLAIRLKIVSVDNIVFLEYENNKREIKRWNLENRKLCNLGKNVSFCHLVPSWNYWQLSFSASESAYVDKYISGEENHIRKTCFMASKQLRNIQDVTNGYEASLLPTYPLKVAFLSQCIDPDTDWQYSTIADRVTEMFKTVHDHGTRGTQSSLFIENHPVLPAGDPAYLEARRNLLYLDQIRVFYSGKVKRHFALMLIIWLLNLGSMIFVYFGLHFENQTILLFPIALSQGIAGLILLVSVICYFWTKHHKKTDLSHIMMKPIYSVRIILCLLTMTIILLFGVFSLLFINLPCYLILVTIFEVILFCNFMISFMVHMWPGPYYNNKFTNTFSCSNAFEDITFCYIACKKFSGNTKEYDYEKFNGTVLNV